MSLRKHEEEEILSKQREWEKVCLFLQPLHLTHFTLWASCLSNLNHLQVKTGRRWQSWIPQENVLDDEINQSTNPTHAHTASSQDLFWGFRVCFSVCTLNMNWQPKVTSYLRKSSRIKDRDQNKPKDKRLLAKKETRWRDNFKKTITNILRDTT